MGVASTTPLCVRVTVYTIVCKYVNSNAYEFFAKNIHKKDREFYIK